MRDMLAVSAFFLRLVRGPLCDGILTNSYFFNNYKGEPVVDNMIKDVESGMDGENAWDKVCHPSHMTERFFDFSAYRFERYDHQHSRLWSHAYVSF